MDPSRGLAGHQFCPNSSLCRASRGLDGLTLRLEQAGQAKVYSLAVNGKRTGEVQASVIDGALTVPLSVSADGKARMLYEIEVQ